MSKILCTRVSISDEDHNPQTFCFETKLESTNLNFEYDDDEKSGVFIDEGDVEDYILNKCKNEKSLEDIGFNYDADVEFIDFEIKDEDD